MTKDELLTDIAKGRTVAERLPLYESAMHLGLLTYQEIQAVVADAEPASQTVTKVAAKKTAAKRTATQPK